MQVDLRLVEQLGCLMVLHLQLNFLLDVNGHNRVKLERKITQVNGLMRVDDESALRFSLSRAILHT